MEILEERLNLWDKIKKIPVGEVTPFYIHELKPYKGQAGICRDETGFAISLLNTGKHYPDDIFEEGLVKRIFLTSDNETNLITNSTLTKTFLILTKKTDYKKLNKSSNDYEKYEAKARLNLINKIYKSYDDNVNQKYKVELNQRTIDRVKNSF